MLRMVSYPHRPLSGHITCYLNRTYHVLPTAILLPVDIGNCTDYRVASIELLIPRRGSCYLGNDWNSNGNREHWPASSRGCRSCLGASEDPVHRRTHACHRLGNFRFRPRVSRRGGRRGRRRRSSGISAFRLCVRISKRTRDWLRAPKRSSRHWTRAVMGYFEAVE